MSKTSRIPRGARPQAETRAQRRRRRRENRDSVRETVESIVVAFVMAFLFRTFELEAFVIPTGSMAPTLMGRHKDLTCPACGYAFTVGMPPEEGFGAAGAPHRAQCPNCQYELSTALVGAQPYHRGDRILVLKFPLEFSRPQRWSVIVFRFPEDTTKNYIKRLIGLPGERISLRCGDVYVRTTDDEPARIQRKSLDKIRALRQLVFDNNYQAQDMDWQARWTPAGEWKAEDGGRAFACDGSDSAAQRLEYRHWMRRHTDEGGYPRPHSVRAGEHAIRDFCGYNSRDGGFGLGRTGDYGFVYDHGLVVDDLMLGFDLTPTRAGGLVRVEIVEAEQPGLSIVLCAAFDFDKQQIRVSRNGKTLKTAPCPALKSGRAHRIEFANFDSRVNLVVDGVDVLDGGVDYDPMWELLDRVVDGPTRPVAIEARGAGVRVSNLVLHRDVYYRAEGAREYVMGDDDYFVLGDNSPRSQDSRLWNSGPTVPGRNLIGNAFVVYWPHGLGPPLPILDFRFIPNVSRMGLIR